MSIHQFANDWMTIDGPGFQNRVVTPDLVQLDTPEEFARFRASYDAFLANGPGHEGQFWQLWTLWPNGTFSRRHS